MRVQHIKKLGKKETMDLLFTIHPSLYIVVIFMVLSLHLYAEIYAEMMKEIIASKRL